MRNWPAAVTVIVLLALALAVTFWLTPPAWVYGAGFVLIFLVYTNTALERVPLYLSNAAACQAVNAIVAERTHTDARRPAFMDLGCGTGTMVAHLAGNHPGWDLHGVETAPVPYLVAKMRTWRLNNAHIHFQSLWRTDLSECDVVYAFLSPAPMARLIDKARREMLPGALFVSNSFWAADEPFDSMVALDDRRGTKLFMLNSKKRS